MRPRGRSLDASASHPPSRPPFKLPPPCCPRLGSFDGAIDGQTVMQAIVAGLGHRREERWSEPLPPNAGLPNVSESSGRGPRRGQETGAELGRFFTGAAAGETAPPHVAHGRGLCSIEKSAGSGRLFGRPD
jgi:hypothetical protein